VGIVRTVEWTLLVPPAEAATRIRAGLEKCGIEAESEGLTISGKSARALLKNRWAAEVRFELESTSGGSIAVARVDMNGNKHYELLGEIAEAIGDDCFDDRGAAEAIERLGKMGRVFGRKEVRHLRNILRGTERVVVLGQGQYGNKQGLIALTTERLVFFEKSLLGQETVEEFSLRSITSLETGKKMTGEKLVITVAGNRSEITHLFHGHADEIVRQYRRLTAEPAAPTAATPTAGPSDDPIAQIQRLAALRDQGIISEADFEQKKAELMQRI
jgi:hypothetical protein